MSMVPRIVHQTWRSAELPEPARAWSQSWRAQNPDFDHRFYDDTGCTEFVACYAPEYLDVYNRLPRPVLRADFFRYLVVYRFGGIYADIDMECLRPFGRFLGIGGLVLSVETKLTGVRQRELGYRAPWQLANCVFAAEPGHWFLRTLIERIARDVRSGTGEGVVSDSDVEDTTGPRMLTRLYYELPRLEKGDITVLSQVYWMPPTLFPRRRPLDVNIHARHHFWGSWKTGDRSAKSLRRRIVERSLVPNPWPRTTEARVGTRPA